MSGVEHRLLCDNCRRPSEPLKLIIDGISRRCFCGTVTVLSDETRIAPPKQIADSVFFDFYNETLTERITRLREEEQRADYERRVKEWQALEKPAD